MLKFGIEIVTNFEEHAKFYNSLNFLLSPLENCFKECIAFDSNICYCYLIQLPKKLCFLSKRILNVFYTKKEYVIVNSEIQNTFGTS